MSPACVRAALLFRRVELAFHTQYAEVKERARSEPLMLPGTPGTLALETGTGHGSWYRRDHPVPGRQADDFVCKQADTPARDTMQARIESAAWTQAQVRQLRMPGFQVADQDVARLLVALHNRRLFAGGLVLVGTLAFMAWLNELGVVAVSSRTQPVDLARGQGLKLGAPLSFLETLEAIDLQFFPVPGRPNSTPSTSVKRPGAEGLRVDMLTPGPELGAVIPVPEPGWFAQTVPHFDHLLEQARSGAVLAAALAELEPGALALAARQAPSEGVGAARQRLTALEPLLAAHPQALQAVRAALAWRGTRSANPQAAARDAYPSNTPTCARLATPSTANTRRRCSRTAPGGRARRSVISRSVWPAA